MTKRKPKDARCGNCTHWAQLADREVDNTGICTIFDRSTMKVALPYWVEGLTFVTLNWQGKECTAWSKKA